MVRLALGRSRRDRTLPERVHGPVCSTVCSCHICAGTGHICAGTRPTSAPGLAPHLRRDCAAGASVAGLPGNRGDRSTDRVLRRGEHQGAEDSAGCIPQQSTLINAFEGWDANGDRVKRHRPRQAQAQAQTASSGRPREDPEGGYGWYGRVGCARVVPVAQR
jgi:hypothetical protein